MTRDLYPDLLTAIEKDQLFPFVAVKLVLDSALVNMWSGYGDQSINGEAYIGVGTLLGISSVEETSELYATGASVSLSGVPSDMIALALTEQYQGRKAYIYLGVTGGVGDWVILDAKWNDGGAWNDVQVWQDSGLSASQIYSGYIDQMNIDEQSDTSVISMTIESKLIDLERVRVYNYTSATQKAEYPADKGFDFVDSLQGKTYNWGRK